MIKQADIIGRGILIIFLSLGLFSCSSMDFSVIDYKYQSVSWSFCVPQNFYPEKKDDVFLNLYCGNSKIVVLTEISLQKDLSVTEYLLDARERYNRVFLKDGKYSFVEESAFKSQKWNGLILISRDSTSGKFWSHYFLSYNCFNMMMLVISDECNAEISSVIDNLIESVNIESPEIIFTSNKKTIYFETKSAGRWSIEIPKESRFVIAENRFEVYLENNLTVMNHFKNTKVDFDDNGYNVFRNKLVTKFNLKPYNQNNFKKDIDMFYEGDLRQPIAVYWIRKMNNGIVVSFAIKTDEQKLSLSEVDIVNEIIHSIKK